MYSISNMEHKEMVNLVKRRLSRLAMCKRGAIATDINEQLKKLGPQPILSKAEKKAAYKARLSDIKKALTPTIAEVAAGLLEKDEDVYYLSEKLRSRAGKILKDSAVPKGLATWQKKHDNILRQKLEREATLDGDFRDVEDEYVLGIKQLSQLSSDIDSLEVREW